jgi:hypothetical protein
MSLGVTPISDDALGRRPRSYDDLCRLAARYAQEHLAGLTFVNQATQLGITLTPDALRAATRHGTSPTVLRAIPALPSLLSWALYVRSLPDRRKRPEVRRVYLLGASTEIAGRTVKVLLAVRENFNGQGFLDSVTARDTPARNFQDGGETPDDNADLIAADSDYDVPEALQEQLNTSSASLADAGEPKLSTRDKTYLDKYYDVVNEMAKKYFVDPTLVLGIGAESGFGTSDIFHKYKDAFGMSGGSIGTQPNFPSYAANVRRFFSEYGPQIWGVGSDADAFINALSAKDASGIPVPGWKKYNTANYATWLQMMQNGIPQMQRSVPLYLQQRDTQ